MKIPVAVLSKTVDFASTVGTSMLETMSVYGDKSHNTPPTSTEAAMFGSCGNAQKKDLSSSKTPKCKSEALKLTDYQLDQIVSIVVEKDHNHQSVALNSDNWSSKLVSKRIKVQVEQNRRQKEEELRQLQEKMQLMELEQELCRCGVESERTTIDGSKVHNGAKHLELDNNSGAGSEAAIGFITHNLVS